MKRALDGVIAELASYPGRPVDLLVGEPCFEPPSEIQTAFERSATKPAMGYGPPAGLAELRLLLAAWAGGSGVDAEQVVVTHGAKGGLLALLAAFAAVAFVAGLGASRPVGTAATTVRTPAGRLERVSASPTQSDLPAVD